MPASRGEASRSWRPRWRSLAQRSADAAKEIAALIGNTVDKVTLGADEAARAGQTIDQVAGAVQQVSAQISEVTRGLSAQESGIAQIDQAMSQLDAATQQNAAMAEQSVSATTSVQQQSQALVETVSQFRLAPA